MTVKDLIAKLQTMPEYDEVLYMDRGTDQQPSYLAIESVFLFDDGQGEPFVAIK